MSSEAVQQLSEVSDWLQGPGRGSAAWGGGGEWRAMAEGGGYLGVLGVGNEPVDRGEMLPLRQLLV